MAGFIFRLLFWIIFLGIFWLAGAYFGAPSLLTNVTNKGFEFVEGHLCNAWEPACNVAAQDEVAASEGNDEASEAEAEVVLPAAPASVGGIEANATLRINDEALAIIKKSEGLRLEAYEAGGRSYIGYGHQLQEGEPRQITEEQANMLLREDIRSSEEVVRSLLTRAATENQYSAMVSLAYNLGSGNFSKSPVLAKFNAGDVQGAADAFLTHNKAGGKVIEHLTHRREEERALFLK